MEFLIWIGFLIVYSILQSTKKKKGPPKVPGDSPAGEGKTPTWGDALRQIQEALEEAQNPNAHKEPAPEAARSSSQLPKLAPESRESRRETIEPEFHTMESRIPDRSLESKTKYSEHIYRPPANTESSSYEDSFPERSFYDEKYSHAHMDESTALTPVAKSGPSPADILRKRLRDKNYLSEAFIIQQLLGKPLSKR